MLLRAEVSSGKPCRTVKVLTVSHSIYFSDQIAVGNQVTCMLPVTILILFYLIE